MKIMSDRGKYGDVRWHMANRQRGICKSPKKTFLQISSPKHKYSTKYNCKYKIIDTVK